ncbi:MAG TPA: MFS transporter [Ktedonobacteraceae bacterium]|jgi:MFS family permease
MSVGPGPSPSLLQPGGPSRKRSFQRAFGKLPRNVYLLLLFTVGKGFQLSLSLLTLNYYVHSLGYLPDFIGIFSAMPALGSLLSAVPVGRLADHLGRKPVLLLTALLTPLFLAACGLVTGAPALLVCAFLQGVVSTAYWVTNLPLLAENTTPEQRVGVLALNSFLLLGIGALGNFLGGAIPEFAAGLLHTSAASTVPLRWGVIAAALFTFVFGLPLWLLQTSKRSTHEHLLEAGPQAFADRWPVWLYLQLLLPDLVFTMGEGAVVALMQLYFVLRFHLLPGSLGLLFTLSGFASGVFSLSAPLFVKRWSKLRLITTVQYLTAPVMLLIGFAPGLPVAIGGEYTRAFLRTLIEPIYAAFALEQVADQQRATLSGFYSVTWSIGFSVGPAIGGWLQASAGLATSFVFGAICLFVAPTLLLTFFGQKTRREIR